MKLLRRLKTLELELPAAIRKNNEGEIIRIPLPMSPAIKFLQECTAIEDGTNGEYQKLKRLKYFLIEQHQSIFGTPPSSDVPLRVIKARCTYRLQSEGFRVAGQEPSERFKINYAAMMQFNDAHPFEGCDRETAWIAGRLTAQETGKVITMSAIKKVASKAKETKTVAEGHSPKAKVAIGVPREMVLGKYAPTAVIRWYAKLGAQIEQIAVAMEKLGVHIARGTIHVQSGKGRKDENIPTVSREDGQKFKDVLPEAKVKPEVKGPQTAPKSTKFAKTAVAAKPVKKLAPSLPKKLPTTVSEVLKPKVLKKLPPKK
jgi:hypothetical protein